MIELFSIIMISNWNKYKVELININIRIIMIKVIIVFFEVSSSFKTTIKPIYSKYLSGIIHSIFNEGGPKNLPISNERTK